MPHKHTRRPDPQTNSQFNLGPREIAKPLPAFTKASKNSENGAQRKPKRKRASGTDGYKEDDTPRAFARMMQYHSTGKKRPSGLDDGNSKAQTKKRKRDEQSAATTTATTPVETSTVKADMPKILPGERLADYAARVDQALPMGNLTRKGNVKIEGMPKERQTKTEKRLHKMYAAWREEEVRIKEKEEEAREAEEEAEDEKDAEYGSLSLPSRKKRRAIGEVDDDDEDPWEVLKEKRGEEGGKGLKGLHDVVQAPPTLKVVPKEKFKVKRGARVEVGNVPTAAGSLKRREELGEARREVIERYRAMMGKGRGGR